MKPPYKTGLYGTETDGDVSKQNLRFLSCIFRLLLATVCTSKEEITELIKESLDKYFKEGQTGLRFYARTRLA